MGPKNQPSSVWTMDCHKAHWKFKAGEALAKESDEQKTADYPSMNFFEENLSLYQLPSEQLPQSKEIRTRSPTPVIEISDDEMDLDFLDTITWSGPDYIGFVRDRYLCISFSLD